MNGLVRNAFANPNTEAPSGSTIFSPTGSDNLFVAQMLARISQNPQKQTLRQYANQVNQMVEKAYMDYGYEKNDVGVAFGGFLETCWEISKGTFKTGEDNAQDKAKTKAAVRQMQNALLASPAFKTMPDKNKQLLYETCTFMMGDLATQWQRAGNGEAKKAAVQQAARQQLKTLFGVGADSLTRRPDGTFFSAGGPSANPEGKATGVAGAKNNAAAPPVTATASKGPLPAASSHGAQIFVKYVFTGTVTRFDQLILFPSGAAFTDLPSKPVSQFDEATLRASLKKYDVGTWKQSGNTIILTFPNKSRDQVTTLRKVPRGWYNGEGKLETDSSYNTYFPVIPLTPAQLAGAWKTESLVTAGFAGGAAPMVAHGNTGNRVFNPNGTFAGGSESFTSATTANVGDGSNSGGGVGVYGTNSNKGAGRWRLDGSLITMESEGKRAVTLAFVLPNWNKTGPPEMLMDGDWWQRPEKK